MKYTLLNDDITQPLLERILAIRNIQCDLEDFFDPSISHYRRDPYLLKGMDIAVDRILAACAAKEKITIFGDYDVDGITGSWCLYNFLTTYFRYEKVEVMFPHRRHDGYGLKTKHIDMMIKEETDLIITVDNGITSIAEASYAREQNIDLIITDHHHAGAIIPDALTVINPQISEKYEFKGLCGAGVAFKLINALVQRTSRSTTKKRQVFSHYLPVVAIATVADVVPIQDENRAIVAKGLEYINQGHMPDALAGMIDFLSIKGPINSYHIGYVIGPRINAAGRITSPYDSLNILLTSGNDQLNKLQALEQINTDRRKLQDDALKHAKNNISIDAPIIMVYDESYHEGIVGIVAGRLTDQYHKPSLVMYLNHDQGTASGSLRCPPYFNIVDMLHDPDIKPLLIRSGGHKQAGGLTVAINDIPILKTLLEKYVKRYVADIDTEKNIIVDTILTPDDITTNHLLDITKLAPFGEGNPEPTFLLPEAKIHNTSVVGKRGQGHLKCMVQYGSHKLTALYRSKGGLHGTLPDTVDIIAKIQSDSYSGGWSLIIDHIITK